MSNLNYKAMSELTRTFYLNNSGSRWVVYKNGKKVMHEWITKSGKHVCRRVISYYSFGRKLVVPSFPIKERKIQVLMDTILED